ncbi:MAG: T9SS type A sorting domain-containing protein [Bacteroidia bacterium]|nr:T9SS type A sorting domain-containing protein [Bacteroidia bacterium]
MDDSSTGGGTVTGASLWYRGISNSGIYKEAKMTLNTSVNKWEIAVDETWLDGMGLEYYFTAIDNSLNAGRLPVSPNIFSSSLNFTTPPSITSSVIKFGGTANDYRIVSIPYKLSDAKVSTIFNEVNNGSADKTAWRLLTYGGGTKWNEYPGDFLNIIEGKGYWINVLTAADIKIEGATTPDFDRLNLYSMTLNAGWNQIGNPYTVPISWNEIKTQDANVGTLKVWSGSGYNNGDILNLFEGGFVFVNGSAPVTVKITFPGIPIGGRVQSSDLVSSDLGNDRWQVPFIISQGQYSNNLLSGIGMSDDSNFGFDKNDDLNAPRFINYLEMNFSHPEHLAKRFSRDVVPVQLEYTWEFSIDSNLDGPAELQWDNTGFGNNNKDLFLLDLKAQTLVNMRETTRFSFNPRESSSFKLFFGTNLKSKIKPAKVLLGQAYPNPSNGMTIIPFSLPDESASYQVSLEVFDMMGKKVNTVINGIFNSGFYNSEWDASLGGLSSGIYTYRLAVSSSKGSEVQSGKIVIKKID